VVSFRSLLRRRPFVALLALILLLLAGYTARAVTEHRPVRPSPPATPSTSIRPSASVSPSVPISPSVP